MCRKFVVNFLFYEIGTVNVGGSGGNGLQCNLTKSLLLPFQNKHISQFLTYLISHIYTCLIKAPCYPLLMLVIFKQKIRRANMISSLGYNHSPRFFLIMCWNCTQQFTVLPVHQDVYLKGERKWTWRANNIHKSQKGSQKISWPQYNFSFMILNYQVMRRSYDWSKTQLLEASDGFYWLEEIKPF